jgi:hypothetical protein
MYADYVEVDKRTFEYLSQLRRRNPRFVGLIHEFFKSSDYAEIPGRLAALPN